MTSAKFCTSDGVKINCESNEMDPQVGNLLSDSWCTTDGSKVICTTSAPVTNESDPQVGSNTTNYLPNSSKLDVNGDINVSGDVLVTSDMRLKEKIGPIESSLDKIAMIKGVTYNWKNRDISNRKHYGVIAQEIEKILPEIVKEGSDGKKRVAYMELIPVLIEAMKEQQRVIEGQNGKIEELKSMLKQVLSSNHLVNK
jgi:hypothetical protein